MLINCGTNQVRLQNRNAKYSHNHFHFILGRSAWWSPFFSKSVVTVVAGPEMIKKSDDGESFDRVFLPVRIRVSISHSFGSVCKASLDIVSIAICTPVCVLFLK